MTDYKYDPVENDFFTVYLPADEGEFKIQMPLGNVDVDSNLFRKVKVNDDLGDEEDEIVAKDTFGMHIDNSPMYETPQSLNYDVNLNLSENKKKAMDYFKSKFYELNKSRGLSDETSNSLASIYSAGVVGNLMAESNLNHKAKNKQSGAYGLALWLGPRKKKLFEKYGGNPTFEQQLDFLWEELLSDEKQSLMSLLSTSTYEAATNSFMVTFERPSKQEMMSSINKRIRNAKSLLA